MDKPGKLVILRVALVLPRPVNQLDDVVDLVVRLRAQQLRLLGGSQVVRQVRQEACERIAQALLALELISVGARPAGILDFLVPRRDLGQIAGKFAARAPEIHLKRERVLARALLDHPLQRRVRDEAAVPVEFAFDLHRRKAGRQRSARHHVLGPDRVRGVIEIDEIAGAHVHGADAEAHPARIDPVEVDKPLQRAFQVLGLVEARRLKGAVRVQPGSRQPRREKARGPTEESAGRAHLVEERAREVAFGGDAYGGQWTSRAAGWR